MRKKNGPIGILVVDDENFFAEWLAENLRDIPHRYDAHWVNSGERALEFMEQQPVDLVISDIKMAGTSGIELLKVIRARHPGVGVILMTGYALPELQQEAVKRGSLFYLEKPFPMEKLESAIEQTLSSLPATAEAAEAESPTPRLSLLDALHLFHLSRSNKTLLVKKKSDPQIPQIPRKSAEAETNSNDQNLQPVSDFDIRASDFPEGVEGLIYYQDGEVVHAVVSRVGEWESGRVGETTRLSPVLPFAHSPTLVLTEGEAAFAQIVSWGSNDYEILMDERAPSRSIFRDFDSLLNSALESAIVGATAIVETRMGEWENGKTGMGEQENGRMGDEANQPPFPHSPPQFPSDQPPEPSDQPPATNRPPVLSDEERRLLQELLAASDHLEGGALIITDGTMVASTLPPALLTPMATADACALFQMCHRLSGGLGRSHHRQSFIQGELGNVILSDVGGGSFLLFVTNAKATLGLALLQARQRAQKISQLVNESMNSLTH